MAPNHTIRSITSKALGPREGKTGKGKREKGMTQMYSQQLTVIKYASTSNNQSIYCTQRLNVDVRRAPSISPSFLEIISSDPQRLAWRLSAAQKHAAADRHPFENPQDSHKPLR